MKFAKKYDPEEDGFFRVLFLKEFVKKPLIFLVEKTKKRLNFFEKKLALFLGFWYNKMDCKT